jgi:hypothetical protein
VTTSDPLTLSTSVLLVDEQGKVQESLHPLQSSTVTRDRTQAIRGSCDLYFADPTGSLSSSLLAPTSESGNLIVVTQGIGGVTPSLLGTYAIQTSLSKDLGDDRKVEVTGQDRSWLIARQTLLAAYSVVPGQGWAYSIQQLLNTYLSGLSYALFENILFSTPSVVINAGSEPWTAAATQWAPACGAELYFTVEDTPALTTLVDPRTLTPSWTFAEGVGCQFVESDHSWSDNDIPNYFVVDGTAPGSVPVGGIAQDLNPNSPTWVGGSYGVIPDYVQNTLVTSASMAQAAANYLLYLGLGAGEPMVLYTYPVPGVDAGQTAYVTRAAQSLNDAMMAIDTVQHALYPGDQTQITGRRIWPWPTGI